MQDSTKCERVYTHCHTMYNMVAVGADTTDLPLASHESLPTPSSTRQYYQTQRLVETVPAPDLIRIPAIRLSLATLWDGGAMNKTKVTPPSFIKIVCWNTWLHLLRHSFFVPQQKAAGARHSSDAQHEDASTPVLKNRCLRDANRCNLLWSGSTDQKGLIHKHLDIFLCQHPHGYIGTVCGWKTSSPTLMRINKTELGANFAPKVRLRCGS